MASRMTPWRSCLAVDADGAGGDGVGPGDGADHFGPAGADDAGDAEDLAVVDGEGDVGNAPSAEVRPRTERTSGPSAG